MSAGPITEADLQAYVDQRLDAARRAEVEAWLAAHPDEAERIADYRRLGADLRGLYEPALLEPVPAALTYALSPGRRRLTRVAAVAAWVAVREQGSRYLFPSRGRHRGAGHGRRRRIRAGRVRSSGSWFATGHASSGSCCPASCAPR